MNIGLKDSWENLLKDLRRISGVYERVNYLMTLFLLSYIRQQALLLLSNKKDKVILDAGCGPGTMTRMLNENRGEGSFIVALDPLVEMLYKVDSSDSSIDKIRGIFEYLPLRDYSIDTIVTAFSLRDAYDMGKAIRELARVLSKDGDFIILDLGKPLENRIITTFLENFYMRVVPLLAGYLLLGRGGRVYKQLSHTYKKYPFTPYLYMFLKRFFRKVNGYYLVLSTISLFHASGKR
jgi:demethylmenaquinone methyltransferase/2-methoxy-6-polyprenyl-1,4-benzoquinol methylase